MTWAVAYELDWRDAFAALGTVNLDSPGATLTFQNITWRTPAVADGNPVNQVDSITWELGSTGLHCVQPNNSRFNSSNNSAPHLYATLTDIAANDSTPFEGDPTRNYLIQCFVSDLTLTTPNVNNEGCGCGVYREDLGSGIGNDNYAQVALGTRGVNANINFFGAGVGGTLFEERLDLALDVPTLHYPGSGHRFDGYVSTFAAGFPANGTLAKIGSWKEPTEVENDIVGDPPNFRIAFFHNSPQIQASSDYDGTIERIRILQR